MKVEHAALWVNDLEGMKVFYETYFNGLANEKYHNEEKAFESYFLTFDSGTRLEIMRKAGVNKQCTGDKIGWAHIAFSLGNKEAVNQLTARLKEDGYRHMNGPRITGDGYYENVFEDPEGNLIELTV